MKVPIFLNVEDVGKELGRWCKFYIDAGEKPDFFVLGSEAFFAVRLASHVKPGVFTIEVPFEEAGKGERVKLHLNTFLAPRAVVPDIHWLSGDPHGKPDIKDAVPKEQPKKEKKK